MAAERYLLIRSHQLTICALGTESFFGDFQKRGREFKGIRRGLVQGSSLAVGQK